MAAAGDRCETPLDLIRRGFEQMPGWMARQPDEACGPIAIELREFADRAEANHAEALRRFEKSGAWAGDGSLSIVDWLRSHGKLSSGAAMQRVAIARQLEQLPDTGEAFQRGDLGYQHVAILSKTAEHVGVATVRQAESTLLEAAKTKDPGQFVAVTKELVSEPKDGLVRLEGRLDAEGGATLKMALDRLMPPPSRDDARKAGQRRADAMVDLARKARTGGTVGSTGGQRPHLVTTASVDRQLAGGEGRDGERNESRAPPDRAGNPTSAGCPGSGLCLPGVPPAGPLVRRASPQVVDARWRGKTGQPRAGLRPASPDAA